MSETTAISAPTSDVVHTTAPMPVPPQPTVLITEQEVLFGTRTALSPGKLSIPRRLFAAVRDAAGSLHLPPPHPHYPADMGYLERSRMAREMDRL